MRRAVPSRTLRRSAIGVPVAVLGFGTALWLLGVTPLPAAPATATDLVGLARRATAMGHGMPLHTVHLRRLPGWVRAHLTTPGRRALRSAGSRLPSGIRRRRSRAVGG